LPQIAITPKQPRDMLLENTFPVSEQNRVRIIISSRLSESVVNVQKLNGFDEDASYILSWSIGILLSEKRIHLFCEWEMTENTSTTNSVSLQREES
jgi:replication fork clamp-binding protein CrfC